MQTLPGACRSSIFSTWINALGSELLATTTEVGQDKFNRASHTASCLAWDCFQGSTELDCHTVKPCYCVAVQLQGQWILRFDDTNPKTCSRENVAAYMQVCGALTAPAVPTDAAPSSSAYPPSGHTARCSWTPQARPVPAELRQLRWILQLSWSIKTASTSFSMGCWCSA